MTLLEAYKEQSSNARALSDLRFKHFTTFIAVTTFLAVVYAHVAGRYERLGLSAMAILVTVLFGLLDWRTEELWRQSAAVAAACYDTLGLPKMENRRQAPLSASAVTRLLFVCAIGSWAFVLLLSLTK